MASLALKRPARSGPLISLVPMIDVMLILLVFFMVTSTYLNLDMIPAVRQKDQAALSAAPPETVGTVMVRLGADGLPVIRGTPVTGPELSARLHRLLVDEPLTQVIILPSGTATTQALISVMDVATRAGVTRLRVIRLAARP